jgi:hypothetical protein
MQPVHETQRDISIKVPNELSVGDSSFVNQGTV